MKTKHLIAGCLAALFLAGGAPAALAGQAGETPARARLRERISDLYLLRLTRALDLTEDQAAKIYPLLTGAEKRKAEAQRKMGLDLRTLRDELAERSPRDEAIQILVDRIRQARRLVRQTDEESEAALDRVLTPVQRARYLIFSVEFLRRVGENLGRMRGVRGEVQRIP